jgi:preprotein translocase subunit SecA
MDYLKDGIGLRAMAQRDPLVEYQREGFTMYQQMMGAIREESIGFLFNLEVEVTQAAGEVTEVEAKGLTPAANEQQRLSYSAPSDDGSVEVRNQRGQVERAATDRAERARRRQLAAQQENAPAQQQPAVRGAFGQRADDSAQAEPLNRAERRAQERRRR